MSVYFYFQSRSPLVRTAFTSARFYSSKQPTLKERLAELIPAEIENVNNIYQVFALLTEGNTIFFRSRQFVLSTARSLLAPSS